MGLDMYLDRELYIWRDNRKNLDIVGAGEVKVNPKKVKSITEEVYYWRKANAIHRWFVDNVQDGNDNCGTYYVPKGKIEELLGLIQKVLEDRSKASEFLPTQDGFFFGSTEYGEDYWFDLIDTEKALKEILKNWDENYTYQYHSSW